SDTSRTKASMPPVEGAARQPGFPARQLDADWLADRDDLRADYLPLDLELFCLRRTELAAAPRAAGRVERWTAERERRNHPPAVLRTAAKRIWRRGIVSHPLIGQIEGGQRNRCTRSR